MERASSASVNPELRPFPYAIQASSASGRWSRGGGAQVQEPAIKGTGMASLVADFAAARAAGRLDDTLIEARLEARDL